MSSFKRPAGGAAGGRGKAAKPEPPARPPYLRGVTALAAPSIPRGAVLNFQVSLVASVGGRLVMKLSDCGSAGPTHVVVKNDSWLEDAVAERDALGAPPSARLVTLQWLYDSHADRNKRDEAAYEPRSKPVEVVRQRSESPNPWGGSQGAAGGGDGAGGAAGLFKPPPPSGEVCVKEGCGRKLLWNEIGPRCGACLRADGASPQLRMLHLRFLIRHPNAAAVAALNELADYEELFGDKADELSAKSFRRAAASLKALPREVRSASELKVLDPPFIGAGMRTVYMPQFWESGTFVRLEEHRKDSDKVKARHLSRLPYVGGPAALAWVEAGFDTGAKVLAAKAAGTLKSKTGHHVANEYAQLALEYADELLQDIRTEDHAPLMAAVAAAVTAAVVPTEGGQGAASRPEITLVGGSHRGKEACHDLDILVVLPRDGAAHAGTLMRALRALADDENVERDANGVPRLVAGLAVDASVASSVAGAAQLDDNDVFIDDDEHDSPRKTSRDKGHGGSKGGHGKALKIWRSSDGSDDPVLRQANKALILVKMRGLPMRHVDLLVVPYHQRAFWLLGWTGSREFERILRGYVKDELAALLLGPQGAGVTLKLTNTALGDANDTAVVSKHGALIPAGRLKDDYIAAAAYPETEQELFALLRLPYREPKERNA